MGCAVPGASGSYSVRLEGCTDVDLTGVHSTCDCYRPLHVVSVLVGSRGFWLVVVIGDVCDLAGGPFTGVMLYPRRWGCVALWLRGWRALPTRTSLVYVTPATVSGPCMLYLYLLGVVGFRLWLLLV